MVDVYAAYTAKTLLYVLLSEREADESISHENMPNWGRHCHFVDSHPYKAWFLIEVDDTPVGAIYLTRQGEIGIGIFKHQRRRGYAKAAIEKLIETNKGPFYANINPDNSKSMQLFGGFGFITIQHTMKLTHGVIEEPCDV